MEGKIIEIRDVLAVSGVKLSTTVIYERDGQQYAGRYFATEPPSYYFGGAAHLPNLTDIDAAWAQAFAPRQKK